MLAAISDANSIINIDNTFYFDFFSVQVVIIVFLTMLANVCAILILIISAAKFFKTTSRKWPLDELALAENSLSVMGQYCRRRI